MINMQQQQHFIKAAWDGNIDKVQELFPFVDINGVGLEETALHGACCKGHEDIVRFLLENKASVNIRDINGSLPLHYASYWPTIIQLLLELNAKSKQTLVIVTHDESIAKRSHRIIHIKDGELN